MRNRKIAALFLASSLTLSTGCTRPEPVLQLKEVPQEVPAGLLDCGTEPGAPAHDAVSVAQWTAAHVLWGRGCAHNLDLIKTLVVTK